MQNLQYQKRKVQKIKAIKTSEPLINWNLSEFLLVALRNLLGLNEIPYLISLYELSLLVNIVKPEDK